MVAVPYFTPFLQPIQALHEQKTFLREIEGLNSAFKQRLDRLYPK